FYMPDTSRTIDLKLSTTDYPALLNSMERNSWVDATSKSALISLLSDIADTLDKKNLVIAVKQNAGEQDYHLGKLTLSEAQAKYAEYLQQAPTKLEEKAATPEVAPKQ